MLSDEEKKALEQARSNITRGNDIESAMLILEKCALDGVIFTGGRINVFKIAVRQILNFLEEYKDKGYLDIVREKVKANETVKKQSKEIEELSDKLTQKICKGVEEEILEEYRKEIEHQKEKRENQKKELAILNAKQIEFNKLVNTVNSYKGQFKRLQKEIEELRNEVMEKELMIDGMKEDRRIAVEEIQEQYYVSKDKIKEILGIEEDIDNEKLVSLLQTIVDENARLEDIEDRKVQIEYNNVFNKGVKLVEDKIKAKIEEIKDGTFDAKIVLQSILEKE